MSTVLCPRCGRNRYTPYGEPFDAEAPYPALSRVVNAYICSPCGNEEAIRDYVGIPLPPARWHHRPKLIGPAG